MFENIECEWPLFVLLLLLDSLIEGNHIKAEEYRAQLNKIVPVNEEGLAIVPELYLVPRETVRELSNLHVLPTELTPCNLNGQTGNHAPISCSILMVDIINMLIML